MSARDELRDALAAALDDTAYLCGRVWEAWGYNTMTEDDFTPAAEDEDFLSSLVDAVQVAMKLPTAEDQGELEGYFGAFDDVGEMIPIRDANHRHWSIGGDEHGDRWALSFGQEEDSFSGAIQFDLAPISYPVTLLWEPTS